MAVHLAAQTDVTKDEKRVVLKVAMLAVQTVVYLADE